MILSKDIILKSSSKLDNFSSEVAQRFVKLSLKLKSDEQFNNYLGPGTKWIIPQKIGTMNRENIGSSHEIIRSAVLLIFRDKRGDANKSKLCNCILY